MLIPNATELKSISFFFFSFGGEEEVGGGGPVGVGWGSYQNGIQLRDYPWFNSSK